MKRAGKIKYVLTAMMLTLLLSVPGCIFDDCQECYEAETGTLVLSLKSSSAATRAGSPYTSTDDDQIVTARVIVFVGDAVEHNDVYTKDDLGPTEDAIRITLATGKKTVYVVANEPTDLTSGLEGVTSTTALEQMMANDISSPLSVPLAMVGKLEDVELEAGLTQCSVTLTRAAAKINIQLKKGVDDPITITKISLISNAKKTTLWENATTSFTQEYWNYESSVSLELLKSEYTQGHIVYVYENLGNSYGNNAKATQLEVEALYGSIPTTYRVYINENVNATTPAPGDPNSSKVEDPADHLYNIKRNYEYLLTGTISGIGEFDGLILKTNVLPWNLLTAEWEFNREYTIDPHPTPANKVYTVNNIGDTVDFTFKLTNSMEGTWMAHLSNPIEFEFSTAGGAVSSGQMGQEYTISVKPRLPQNDTERTTEFYITVDGVEVSLLQGSNLVGAGNRIVITQLTTTP